MQPLDVFVIGQSPRPEIEAEIGAAAPALNVRIRGALDGLSRAEIEGLRPRSDADALFTILPGGDRVVLSKTAVGRRLADLLDGTPALIACTGAFAELPARPGLIYPSAVLNERIAAMLPRGRLGLAVPLREQVATLTAARGGPNVEARAVVLAPGSDDALRDQAAAELASFRPDLVVLDCISYGRADAARFAARIACPILLAIAVAAEEAERRLLKPAEAGAARGRIRSMPHPEESAPQQ